MQANIFTTEYLHIQNFNVLILRKQTKPKNLLLFPKLKAVRSIAIWHQGGYHR